VQVSLARTGHLLPHRLCPAQRAHEHGGEEHAADLRIDHGPAPVPAPSNERNDAERAEQRHEQRVAQMRLDNQAPHADRPRQRNRVAARERPHEEQKQQERQQHAVWRPRVEQQLAAHGPRQCGRGSHRHDDGARVPAAPSAGGDAEDGHAVQRGDAERDSWPWRKELHGQGEPVEEERSGVVEVHPCRPRRGSRAAQERVVAREHIARAQLEVAVVADREPAVVDSPHGRHDDRHEGGDDRDDCEPAVEGGGGRRSVPRGAGRRGVDGGPLGRQRDGGRHSPVPGGAMRIADAGAAGAARPGGSSPVTSSRRS
jgi:hypothetical protein